MLVVISNHDIVRGWAILPRPRRMYEHNHDRTRIAPRSDSPPLARRAPLRHLSRFGPYDPVVRQMVGGIPAQPVDRPLRSFTCAPHLAPGDARHGGARRHRGAPGVGSGGDAGHALWPDWGWRHSRTLGR